MPSEHSSVIRRPPFDPLPPAVSDGGSRGLAAIRAPEASDVSAELPTLSVDLDDLYLADEAVEIRATLVNGEADGDGFGLDQLEAGGYRIEVGSRTSRSAAPPPVHGVFVVAG